MVYEVGTTFDFPVCLVDDDDGDDDDDDDNNAYDCDNVGYH